MTVFPPPPTSVLLLDEVGFTELFSYTAVKGLFLNPWGAMGSLSFVYRVVVEHKRIERIETLVCYSYQPAVV